MTAPQRRLVVVGGGIAGLSAAWTAAGRGFDVVVLEASPRVGGKLLTARLAGVPLDVGAEALLTTRPEAVALLDEAGLAGERIAPLTTAARVRAGGRSWALPARTMMGIPTDSEAVRASGVLTPDALARIDAEPDREPLPPLDGDVAVGALVRERLGDEIADRLVEPLLGGVYSGRADALSLRATVPALAARLTDGGSLVTAARGIVGAGTRAPGAGPVFTSLRGGLGRLPATLAASGRFAVRTSVTVRSIERTPTGFALETGAVPAAERIEADLVIVAVPPAKAARLLGRLAPVAAHELADVETASSAIVSLAFRGVDLPEGSGLLVGTGERLATKAVTLSSNKWPLETGTADGTVLLRASVGRAGEPQALQLPDDELVRLVRRELHPLVGVSAEPVDALVTRWGGGLPQYGVGHVERVSRIRAAVAAVPGLAVCGATYDGVGVPACIASAHAAVARLDPAAGRGGHWDHG
ncbi:protoporphyrinogen oxidase [Jatrophihabitans endophyticus]|uniref:protoporphyrinogen oxidase n=1 Tax=Jatrophihabitans endophyticus TaxID=1206085 RepID=UPI0019E3028A|nr:protoporphyrinogen oxidase [Jatrophihabitans endophyticus]MBE7187204.1 protoporphyrinogen oxidase [Jatrophihabitans endophyticus]